MASKKFFRARRLYVPKPSRSRHTYTWGWETGLTGWSGLDWEIVATQQSRLLSGERSAWAKTVRKLVKKKANLQLNVHRNHVLTGRPVGIRMGKGKGKGRDHCCWVRPGTSIAILGSSSARVANLTRLLDKRSSFRPVLVRSFY